MWRASWQSDVYKRQELEYAPPESGLPFVTGDPRRLKQVVLNILDNAAKYGRGGRKIEVRAMQQGEYVKISVRCLLYTSHPNCSP